MFYSITGKNLAKSSNSGNLDIRKRSLNKPQNQYEGDKKRPQVTKNARGGYNINTNVTHKNTQQLVVPCTLVSDCLVSVKPLGSNRFNMPVSKTLKTLVEAPMSESKTP